jgi:hypothetical protein
MAVLILCVSCGCEELRDSGARFCHSCQEQHHYEQRRAIGKVANAVFNGVLPKPSEFDCTDCGAPARQWDHRDYTLPLAVEPVCIACNIRRGPALDSQMRAVLRDGRSVDDFAHLPEHYPAPQQPTQSAHSGV